MDLDLPEGLLVGLGYAATSPDSPLDFRQAQTAAERSGVANPHCWSSMLPTSARVAQEVYEPLIGIQYPMLCSRMGDTWQIGTTSIREEALETAQKSLDSMLLPSFMSKDSVRA